MNEPRRCVGIFDADRLSGGVRYYRPSVLLRSVYSAPLTQSRGDSKAGLWIGETITVGLDPLDQAVPHFWHI